MILNKYFLEEKHAAFHTPNTKQHTNKLRLVLAEPNSGSDGTTSRCCGQHAVRNVAELTMREFSYPPDDVVVDDEYSFPFQMALPASNGGKMPCCACTT